jgi:hypothetical protein
MTCRWTLFTLSILVLSLTVLPAPPVRGDRMAEAEEPEEVSYTTVGPGYFPAPEGVERIAIPGGDFETFADKRPEGLHIGGFKAVKNNDAPQGESYIVLPADRFGFINWTGIDVKPNTAHLLSMWVRSEAPFGASLVAENASIRFGRWNGRRMPSTKGQWKRVGLYFRTIDGNTKARLWIRFDRDKKHPPVALDDIRLRRATEDEYTRAYNGWRKGYPARDLSPRPDDGKHLALTIHKLKNGFDPPRPFVIWAIGSSWTNMLGMGETLRQEIRRRFPNAPPIVYKKHVGSSAPFELTRGWVRQFVVSEQPDLLLLYGHGETEGLEKLLKEFRKRSTADVIVPSLHILMRDGSISDKVLDTPYWSEKEEVAERYGVEFVRNRHEWADYMKEHGLKLEVDKKNGLLKDAVHQSDYGALVINENIARHFTTNVDPAYRPEERERRLTAKNPQSIRPIETVAVSGKWTRKDERLISSEKGATMTVTFQGNRLDLIGHAVPDGGTADVEIDGKPASKAPAFFMTYIEPGKKNSGRHMKGDRAPHAVILGENVVPQSWTIELIDDEGNFEVTGSETGKDGRGNILEPFTSDSGQIIMDPDLWRNKTVRRGKNKGKIVPKAGDTYSFEVYHAATPTVSFEGEGGKFRTHIVQNLTNEKHSATLTVRGDGPVVVEAFDVFEPPLK